MVQDLNLLPTVHVRDIERLERDVVVDSHEYEKVKIHFVKENTNGMTFLRLKFNLGKITSNGCLLILRGFPSISLDVLHLCYSHWN